MDPGGASRLKNSFAWPLSLADLVRDYMAPHKALLEVSAFAAGWRGSQQSLQAPHKACKPHSPRARFCGCPMDAWSCGYAENLVCALIRLQSPGILYDLLRGSIMPSISPSQGTFLRFSTPTGVNDHESVGDSCWCEKNQITEQSQIRRPDGPSFVTGVFN
jgi:hypothetical protein